MHGQQNVIKFMISVKAILKWTVLFISDEQYKENLIHLWSSLCVIHIRDDRLGSPVYTGVNNDTWWFLWVKSWIFNYHSRDAVTLKFPDGVKGRYIELQLLYCVTKAIDRS